MPEQSRWGISWASFRNGHGELTDDNVLDDLFVDSALRHTALEHLVQQAVARGIPEGTLLGLGQGCPLCVLQAALQVSIGIL